MIYLYCEEAAKGMLYRLLRLGLLLCEQLLVSSICNHQTIRHALQARKGTLAASLVPTLTKSLQEYSAVEPLFSLLSEDKTI